MEQVWKRPYTKRYQWKEPVKWLSLVVVAIAAGANVLFYYANYDVNSDAAASALASQRSSSMGANKYTANPASQSSSSALLASSRRADGVLAPAAGMLSEAHAYLPAHHPRRLRSPVPMDA